MVAIDASEATIDASEVTIDASEVAIDASEVANDASEVANDASEVTIDASEVANDVSIATKGAPDVANGPPLANPPPAPPCKQGGEVTGRADTPSLPAGKGPGDGLIALADLAYVPQYSVPPHPSGIVPVCPAHVMGVQHVPSGSHVEPVGHA